MKGKHGKEDLVRIGEPTNILIDGISFLIYACFYLIIFMNNFSLSIQDPRYHLHTKYINNTYRHDDENSQYKPIELFLLIYRLNLNNFFIVDKFF